MPLNARCPCSAKITFPVNSSVLVAFDREETFLSLISRSIFGMLWAKKEEEQAYSSFDYPFVSNNRVTMHPVLRIFICRKCAQDVSKKNLSSDFYKILNSLRAQVLPSQEILDEEAGVQLSIDRSSCTILEKAQEAKCRKCEKIVFKYVVIADCDDIAKSATLYKEPGQDLWKNYSFSPYPEYGCSRNLECSECKPF